MRFLAEHCVEHGSLRVGQRVETVLQQQHELVHGGVPEGHLRLDADEVQTRELGRGVDRVLHERGFLPDPGWTRQEEPAGDAALGVAEQVVDRGPFRSATNEELGRGISCTGSCTVVTTSPSVARSITSPSAIDR